MTTIQELTEAGVYRVMRRSGDMPNGMGFWRNECGQDLVEYALIVAAVALALLVAIGSMSGAMRHVYDSMAGKLTGIEWQEARR